MRRLRMMTELSLCSSGNDLDSSDDDEADGSTVIVCVFADIDECETGQAACAHSCHNNHGSFTCLCNPGYELGSDGRKCYRKSGHISLALQSNQRYQKYTKQV